MHLIFPTIAALMATAQALVSTTPPDTRLPRQDDITVKIPSTIVWETDGGEPFNMCIDLVMTTPECFGSTRVANNISSSLGSHLIDPSTVVLGQRLVPHYCDTVMPTVEQGVVSYQFYYGNCIDVSQPPNSQHGIAQMFKLDW